MAFSISTPTAVEIVENDDPSVDVSQSESVNCNNDYLVIPGGFNVGNPPVIANMAFDRFCGQRLNALPGSTDSTTVCSKFDICLDFSFQMIFNRKMIFFSVLATATPFRMLYRTNRDETLTTPTADQEGTGNRGFCLNFRVQ
jgi:hypothetical protein